MAYLYVNLFVLAITNKKEVIRHTHNAHAHARIALAIREVSHAMFLTRSEYMILFCSYVSFQRTE